MSDDRLIGTLAGASSEVAELRDDEPTWQHSTVPSSQHAANSGSHVAGVDRRHAQRGGVLGERDRVAALRREPVHLGRGALDVEQRAGCRTG